MAKIAVKKSAAKSAAPAPDLAAEDLGISAEDFDLDLDNISVDGIDGIEGIDDLNLDTLGISEIDDTAITVEDVEAAMQSLTTSEALSAAPAGVASVQEAALAALSAEVAKVAKAVKDSDKSQKVLEALVDLKESVLAFAEGVTGALERHTAFVAERLDALETRAANAPASAPAPAADLGSENRPLDSFLKTQFEGLASGKLYPADKVAAVFSSRLGGVPVDQVLARMQVVYADAFAAAGKPGLFQK